jgi:hypothetical protein
MVSEMNVEGSSHGLIRGTMFETAQRLRKLKKSSLWSSRYFNPGPFRHKAGILLLDYLA